jgi:hypothetical protein
VVPIITQLITAYPGICPLCQQRYESNEPVVYDSLTHSIYHVQCCPSQLIAPSEALPQSAPASQPLIAITAGKRDGDGAFVRQTFAIVWPDSPEAPVCGDAIYYDGFYWMIIALINDAEGRPHHWTAIGRLADHKEEERIVGKTLKLFVVT